MEGPNARGGKKRAVRRPQGYRLALVSRSCERQNGTRYLLAEEVTVHHRPGERKWSPSGLDQRTSGSSSSEYIVYSVRSWPCRIRLAIIRAGQSTVMCAARPALRGTT